MAPLRQRHAARPRNFICANDARCAGAGAYSGRPQADLVDSRESAGLGPLRLHTVIAGADVRRGTGVLERGGYLSFRRRLWRNGSPLAGNDSSVRRPCALSAFPMAFHLSADFFGRRLRGFFRVEPEGNCARGVYLGCLAWNDAQRRSRTCALPKGLALSLLNANCTNRHQFSDVEAKSWINSCQFVTFVSHSGDGTGFGRCS